MKHTKTFSQWLSEPQIEADLRSHVEYLHKQSKGWRYGIDAGDLFHGVVIKLIRRNHTIPSRGNLFSLVSTTALRRLMDLSKKYSFRSALFSKPMPSRLRPEPGSSMKTVASKTPSPAIQAALNDEVAMIRDSVAKYPALDALFKTIEELSGKGESLSIVNIAGHLDLPCKQVRKSMEKLRSAARRSL